jgi:hypothetical protein
MVQGTRGRRNRGALKLGILGSALAVALLVVGPGLFSTASQATPKGNNGTVKVDGTPFDSLHDNEPHPGCSFELTLFDFDQGSQTFSYTFKLQPPSGTATLVSKTITFEGGPGFDAGTGAIDLSDSIKANGGVAQQNQGYHIYLSVDTGSGPKHKVFWVNCNATQVPVGTVGIIGFALLIAGALFVVQRRSRRQVAAS